MAYSDDVRRRFARWYVRDKAERAQRWGVTVPQTVQAYGDDADIAPRTLRRWLSRAEEGHDPEFAGMLAAARGELAAGAEPKPDDMGVPEGMGGSKLEQEFAQVRDALYEQARAGDVQAMKVWIGEFGDTLVSREKQALESDLAGLSDRELLKTARDLTNTLEGLLTP